MRELVPRLVEVPGQFVGELGGPGGGGMLGNSEQVYAAGLEFDDERDVQPSSFAVLRRRRSAAYQGAY